MRCPGAPTLRTHNNSQAGAAHAELFATSTRLPDPRMSAPGHSSSLPLAGQSRPAVWASLPQSQRSASLLTRVQLLVGLVRVRGRRLRRRLGSHHHLCTAAQAQRRHTVRVGPTRQTPEALSRTAHGLPRCRASALTRRDGAVGDWRRRPHHLRRPALGHHHRSAAGWRRTLWRRRASRAGADQVPSSCSSTWHCSRWWRRASRARAHDVRGQAQQRSLVQRPLLDGRLADGHGHAGAHGRVRVLLVLRLSRLPLAVLQSVRTRQVGEGRGRA